MIRLGLRLALTGGREAVVRLVILAVAVGLGVGLWLTALSAINAVNAQNDRHAWLWTGTTQEPAGHAPAGTDPLWWSISGDNFSGRLVVRVDVAATGPTSPVPPGIPRDPHQASTTLPPALASLLRSTPADELARPLPRPPGRHDRQRRAAVPGLAVHHHRAPRRTAGPQSGRPWRSPRSRPPCRAAMGAGTPRAWTIRRPTRGSGPAALTSIFFLVVALAMLTPLLIFIATATRLSAARREQRFAAMRLVGARPRQISVIAAVESTVASAAGVAAGFGLFFVLRILLAAVPFTGEPFFPGDLSLSLPDILVVAIGVPAVIGLAARLALRRVQISPLGVTRRVTPDPPRAWRVFPLLAGAAWLGFFVVHGRPATPSGQIQALVPGFLLIMIGLVIAVPGLDDDRRPDHGPPRQPPGRADRRPTAGRRPAGRVPRRQRPGPGPVHHHRGHRGQHHPGREGGPPDRLGFGSQRPGGRPGWPAAAQVHRQGFAGDGPEGPRGPWPCGRPGSAGSAASRA